MRDAEVSVVNLFGLVSYNLNSFLDEGFKTTTNQ